MGSFRKKRRLRSHRFCLDEPHDWSTPVFVDELDPAIARAARKLQATDFFKQELGLFYKSVAAGS
jgi:hypothetical protein